MMPRGALAEGILDQQLGPAASEPADSNAPKAAVPAPINPAAAKAVDDADLVKQLTNPNAQPKDSTNPSQQLQEMIDRMGDSQTRLSGKDPGAVTQESQRRIVSDLDTVIEYVRKQQQGQSSSKPKPGSESGEKRQQSQGQQQGNRQQPGNHAAQDSQLMAGNVETPQSNGESLRNKGPSEWGNLPPKDRDLISNGSQEKYLPAYQSMIDRYYEALAEVGKVKEKP
jgi:hypothetical protein